MDTLKAILKTLTLPALCLELVCHVSKEKRVLMYRFMNHDRARATRGGGGAIFI